MNRFAKTKIADRIVEDIKNRILNGELKEGDKLPNQNVLAKELGVSPVSLREALHTLAIFGVIEQRPGVGTVVRTRVPTILAGHYTIPEVDDRQAKLELIESRNYIEIVVVELAANNATDIEIEKLGLLTEQMQYEIQENDSSRYGVLNTEFHSRIAAASHNRFLTHYYVVTRSLIMQHLSDAFFSTEENMNISNKGHIEIYQAIRDRNAGKANKLMRKHVRNVTEYALPRITCPAK